MRPALLALCALLGAAAAHARPTPGELAPPDVEAPPVTAPAPLVVIDPGHGGQDWGATVKGRREKDIALAVALQLKAKLETRGARVELTRSDDRFVELDERVERAAATGGALFISLHADKVRQRKVSGMAVYAFGKDGGRKGLTRRRHRTLPPLPPPPAEQAKRGTELAVSLVRSLREDGFRVEPAARAEYYVLKNPKLPAVLVELGFLSNPSEAAKLGSAAYQGRVADALALSVDEYLSGRAGLASAGR